MTRRLAASCLILVVLAGCGGHLQPRKTGSLHPRGSRPDATSPVQRRFIRRIAALERQLKQTSPTSCDGRRLMVRLGWLRLFSGLHRGKARSLFLGAGGQSVLADLGLASMAETDDRAADALGKYLAVLRSLVQPATTCSGDEGLIKGGRCSIARFAVRRLAVLLPKVEKGIDPAALWSLAAKLSCGWAARRMALLARNAALRMGRPDLVPGAGKTGNCPRQWRVSLATGLGALDIIEDRKLAFETLGIDSSHGCRPSLTHPDGLAGVARAEALITLARPERLLIWVSGDGRPIRFAVDGRPILTAGQPWTWPKVVRNVCVELSAGTHTLGLDVPVGAGRVHPGLWVTGLDQRLLSGVSFRPWRAKALHRAGRGSGGGLRPCRAGPWPDVPRFDPDFRLLAVLLEALDKDLIGDRDAAEVLARRLSSGAFVEGLWLTARGGFLPSGLTPDEIRGRISARLRRALDIAPQAAMLRRWTLDLMVALGKVEEIIGKRGQGTAEKRTWGRLAAKVRVFLDRYWTGLARRTLDALLSVGPDRPELWRLAWEVGWQSGDRNLEKRAALRLHELDATDDHWARFLLASGHRKEALVEYRRLLGLGAFPRRDAEGLARVLLAGRRSGQAADLLNRLLSRERWNVSLWMDLVNSLLQSGQRGRAIGALRKALSVRPDSREIRRALVVAAGSLGLDPLRRDGLKAIRAYEQTEWGKRFGPGPVFVLDDMVDLVLPGGGAVELVHQLIHFRSGTDLGLWGQIPIPAGADLLRLRVIKKDGRILVPDRADNGPVNLPGIEFGDYAELEFVRGYRPVGALSGGFAGPRFFFATARAATMGSRYQVVVPAGMALQVDRRGHAPRGLRSTLGDRVLWTWHGGPHDRVRLEDHAPPQDVWLPSVRVASGVTWQRLAAASRRRFLFGDRPSAAMRALARRFCGGKRRRLVELYDWVLDHVDQAGNLSDQAPAVLYRGRGYRLNLLRGLLRLCGAQVDTVMIRPTHRAGPDGAVEDLRPYGYAALELHEGRRVFYLFPYIKYIPFGFLPAMLRGAQAVRVEGHEIGPFVTPGNAGRDRVQISMDIRFDARGHGYARVVERLEGWPAITLRRGRDRSTRRTFEQVFQRERLGVVFPGATGRRLKISVDRARRDLVTLRYEVSSSSIAHLRGNSLTVRRSFFGLHLARRYLQGTDKRTLPIQVGAFPDFELHVSITGPKGWRILSSSGNASVASAWGQVRRSRLQDAGRLTYTIRRHVPFSRISATKMGALARFLRKADAVETLVLTFSRGMGRDHRQHGTDIHRSSGRS